MDAIAAGSLGVVQGFVGSVDEFFDGGVVEEDRYSEAACDLKRTRDGQDGSIGDGDSKLFGAFECIFERAAGEGDDEFFAAIPPGEIVGTGEFADTLSDALEDGVADEVAVGIVDKLEVIDICHEDGDGEVFALCADEFLAEHFEDGSAIPESGEAVSGGQFIEGEAGGFSDLDGLLELCRSLAYAIFEFAVSFYEVAHAEPVYGGSEEQED